MAEGRSAENTANTTATGQNQTYYDNSQNSYANAQTDAGDYQKQLSSYAGADPYGTGGAYQTATNQQLSNTAGSAAKSAGEALQSQALRTGGNTSAGIAATEQMEEANERGLGADEAKATQQRIGDQAAYNQSVLNATAVPVGQQTTLAGQQGGLATGAANTAVNAANDAPSFGDELSEGLSKGLSTGFGQKIPLCWIAAELWNGWSDPRTMAVREWLMGDYAHTAIGRVVVSLYRRFGERTAKMIHKHSSLRALFLPIFNLALKKARR